MAITQVQFESRQVRGSQAYDVIVWNEYFDKAINLSAHSPTKAQADDCAEGMQTLLQKFQNLAYSEQKTRDLAAAIALTCARFA